MPTQENLGRDFRMGLSTLQATSTSSAKIIKESTITRIADGSRLISVDNRHYQIPDSMAAGQKVSVVRHPYEYPNVEVHFNGHVWLCEPIPEDIYGRVSNGTPYGEYKTPKYTETQKAKAKTIEG